MKRILINIIMGTMCGIIMSLISFFTLLLLSSRTFLSSYLIIMITALFCVLVLFCVELLWNIVMKVKKGKLFYIMCVVFYLVGVPMLTGFVLHGMDQIAIFLYFIPIGLLCYGLRLVIYVMTRIIVYKNTKNIEM